MLYFSRIWGFIRCQFKKYAVCFHAAKDNWISRLLATFKAKHLKLRPSVFAEMGKNTPDLLWFGNVNI